ncbi:hypothetical protein ATANTOWER_030250, partial [Ataeniobius toweri]|nr:hypothetical protein [Ataeniobius toweri]
ADHAGPARDKGGDKVDSESAGPAHLINKDPDKKMREFSSDCEDADTADSSPDTDEEDPMVQDVLVNLWYRYKRWKILMIINFLLTFSSGSCFPQQQRMLEKIQTTKG